ncbi:hypothetical protein R1flu_004299 [Riccia fluitans]|uniref:Uncharacterized protein n=1 Tax=Riccia fluitans TaxID=41844 RepID=A0ABD1YQA0_9MARC
MVSEASSARAAGKIFTSQLDSVETIMQGGRTLLVAHGWDLVDIPGSVSAVMFACLDHKLSLVNMHRNVPATHNKLVLFLSLMHFMTRLLLGMDTWVTKACKKATCPEFSQAIGDQKVQCKVVFLATVPS